MVERIEEGKRIAASALAVAGHVIRNIDAAPKAISDIAEWGIAGAPMVGEDELAERKAICGGDATREKCPQWLPTEPGGSLMHCAVCKCLAAKLAMATTRCPLGKWGPVVPK